MPSTNVNDRVMAEEPQARETGHIAATVHRAGDGRWA
jgi:hypothetical protein